MKKIILIFLVLFICIRSVKAIENDVWTEEFDDSPDLTLIRTETRYKWYENIPNYSDQYYIEGEKPIEFPFIDNNRYIMSDYSDWIELKPIIKLNREIETKKVFRYKEIKPIRYIFIENKTIDLSKLYITEIYVENNGQKIPIDVSCYKCGPSFIKVVTDNIIGNSNTYVNFGGFIRIDLGELYEIYDLDLIIYVDDPIPNQKKLNIYYNSEYFYDINHLYKTAIFDISRRAHVVPEKIVIKADNNLIYDKIDWIYSDIPIMPAINRKIELLYLYRYRDVEYSYYKIDKIYLGDYYVDSPGLGYIRDDLSAKDFYQYETVFVEDKLEEEEVVDNNASTSEDAEILSENIEDADDVNIPEDIEEEKVVDVDDANIPENIEEKFYDEIVDVDSISPDEQELNQDNSLPSQIIDDSDELESISVVDNTENSQKTDTIEVSLKANLVANRKVIEKTKESDKNDNNQIKIADNLKEIDVIEPIKEKKNIIPAVCPFNYLAFTIFVILCIFTWICFICIRIKSS